MKIRILHLSRDIIIHLGAWLAAFFMLTIAGFAQNEAVLVIDHSGSMWARMEEVPKVSLIRKSIASQLKEREGKIDLGMVVYGVRKKKSCDTVDAIKDVGAIDPKADAALLEGVRPKGTAPVADALKQAAKQFKTQTGIRTVILISDSMDDCEADPCAVAKDVKQSFPQTVMHVIGFDKNAEQQLQPLACIARESGGVFQTAANAAGLDKALRKVFQLAEAGLTEDSNGRAIPVSLTNQDVVAAPQVDYDPNSKEPGTLVLSAMLAKGTPQLRNAVIWRIFDAQVQADANYRLLHRFDQSRTVVTLPPGEYLVNAAYGRANLTKRVTVWPGKRKEDVFNLNAGGLRLYATLAKEALLSEQSLVFDVYSEETDQFGNRRRVVTGAKPGIALRLNAGNFRIESTYGDANSVMEVDVKVEPGKLTEATIDHQAGKVTFKLVEQAGGEALADTIWRIYGTDGVLVKKSGGAFPSHVLAAGEYNVRVQHGDLEYAARFAVKPGDKKQVEVLKPK